jgi:hypothetical protein
MTKPEMLRETPQVLSLGIRHSSFACRAVAQRRAGASSFAVTSSPAL